MWLSLTHGVLFNVTRRTSARRRNKACRNGFFSLRCYRLFYMCRHIPDCPTNPELIPNCDQPSPVLIWLCGGQDYCAEIGYVQATFDFPQARKCYTGTIFFNCISYLEQLSERCDRAAGWTNMGAWFDSLKPPYRVFALTTDLIIVLRRHMTCASAATSAFVIRCLAQREL